MKKLAVLLCFTLLMPFAFAKEGQFKEGTQYYDIKPTPKIGVGEEVELLEFFWYGCPHCYHFEPTLEKWVAEKKPANVKFKAVPIIFPRNKSTTLHAETFYALELMGEQERMHKIVFDTIHKERKRLNTLKSIKKLMAKNGIDAEQFVKVMESFAVQSKVRRAAILAQRFGVTGVPTLVIDSRYRSGGGMQSYEEMLDMVTFLNTKVITDRTTAETLKNSQ